MAAAKVSLALYFITTRMMMNIKPYKLMKNSKLLPYFCYYYMAPFYKFYFVLVLEVGMDYLDDLCLAGVDCFFDYYYYYYYY